VEFLGVLAEAFRPVRASRLRVDPDGLTRIGEKRPLVCA
jgi:hypothetical protein